MKAWLYTLADYPRMVLARHRQGWSWFGAVRSSWMCSTDATRSAVLVVGWWSVVVGVVVGLLLLVRL